MSRTTPIHLNLTELRGLIFDCDGVLLNSRTANMHFYNTLRKKAGMPPLTAQEEEFVHMSTYEQALNHIFKGAERAKVSGFVEEMADNFDYFNLLEVEDGLIAMLTWLKQNKIKLAICTNRLSPLEPLLERFGLEGFFNPLQTASSAQPKPSPEGLQNILNAWHLKQGAVAYIGDSKVDEAASAAAQIPFWAFKNPTLSANLHITSFTELHDWLKIALNI
ncbi:HAD family hydrolase [Desulfovibrio sp. OttesenSCG-928-F07]|nr:HAD family hydrolase [Desulfovibrio sp. OttesenSCG-928-F07]